MNVLHSRRGVASAAVAPGIDVLDAPKGSPVAPGRAGRKGGARSSLLACVLIGLAFAAAVCALATLMRTIAFAARTRRLTEEESGKEGTCARLRPAPIGVTPDILNVTKEELGAMTEWEFGQRFIKGQQPFVMRGALPRDTELASDESLVRAFDKTHAVLMVEDWTNHTINGLIDDENGRKGTPFGASASDFVADAYDHPVYVITNYTIAETPPAGIENVDLPAIIVKVIRQSWLAVITSIWWSASGANTHWHMGTSAARAPSARGGARRP